MSRPDAPINIKAGDYVYIHGERGPEWFPIDEVVGGTIWVLDGDGKDWEHDVDSILDYESREDAERWWKTGSNLNEDGIHAWIPSRDLKR